MGRDCAASVRGVASVCPAPVVVVTEDGPLPDLTPPNGVTELANLSLEGTGDGDGDPSTPLRYPRIDPPPGDDDDSDTRTRESMRSPNSHPLFPCQSRRP